jgi:hypothetical protein
MLAAWIPPVLPVYHSSKPKAGLPVDYDDKRGVVISNKI